MPDLEDEVAALGRAVALVREEDERRGDATFREGIVDLDRLAGGHSRVVDALNHEERRLHAVEIRDGAELLQRLGVLVGIALSTPSVTKRPSTVVPPA